MSDGLGMVPPDGNGLHVDASTAPFWQAGRRGQLTVQSCSDCGTFRMPPTPFCSNCRSPKVSWTPLGGGGVVHTFTVARSAPTPQLKEILPYVIGVINLDGADGCRLVANVTDVSPSEIYIGMRVQCYWIPINDDLAVYRFRPLAAQYTTTE